ncbi:PREDICTED: uncharacterized protein LOC104596005 [Nelumbo nucifera]|uniref:Uncharacterized protein LOC104596005 n=2 Tax=Nelumbo nucifera TaxID=4432 RepID=A0A1U8A2A1_NELNU|nr:PREDICTED: uncharacterized protein LOC104596005 [Nelumbo nucifera]DAD18976.1 TPA_asm: hypothetical protein HUJ06_020439 [Nelumbo nucifera]
MSSHLSFHDDLLFPAPFSDMVSPEVDLQFLSEPFFPFTDPTSDILHSSDDPDLQFPAHPSPSANQSVTNILSCSPPSLQLDNLSLSPTMQLQPVPTVEYSAHGNTGSSASDVLGIKSGECYVGFDNLDDSSPFAHSNATVRGTGIIQRSFSSQYLDLKPRFIYQPPFNSLVENPNSEIQFVAVGSPENNKLSIPMRRVCSTGDLQRINGTQVTHGLSSSPLGTENSFMEEASLKVGRYSAEERKQRILRYRSKRTQRNFNKTIKYACRKTLADSRPRVRGRFARNDETGEIPKVTGLNRDEEDDDELWIVGFQEDEETMMSGGFLSPTTQFQYHGF